MDNKTMIPIKIDVTNLLLLFLATIFVMLSSAFSDPLKEVALISGVGLILVAGIRTFYLNFRRDGGKPQKRREKVQPNKLQQISEQVSLRQAIKLIKSGDNDGARNILTDIVVSNPDSEEAWLWLTYVVSPDKRAFCLEKVLSINPNNTEAKQYLEKLKTSEIN